MFDDVYPVSSTEVATAQQAASSVDPSSAAAGEGPRGGERRPHRSAPRPDELVRPIAAGGLVLRVYGDQALPMRPLKGALMFGDERTLEDDPAFTLRLLVDVAIKALSPAVNDPTTAVQCLHRIADVLRYAAAKHLSTGVVTDDRGAVRVLVPTPTWDDLIADLPVKRHPALARQLDLLEEAVGRLPLRPMRRGPAAGDPPMRSTHPGPAGAGDGDPDRRKRAWRFLTSVELESGVERRHVIRVSRQDEGSELLRNDRQVSIDDIGRSGCGEPPTDTPRLVERVDIETAQRSCQVCLSGWVPPHLSEHGMRRVKVVAALGCPLDQRP
nr:DUF2254 family protein [Candidatus Microthrix sp.]